MNVTLYVKLEGFDDGDFDMRNDYYSSDAEFFDAMDRENKKIIYFLYDEDDRKEFYYGGEG